MFKRGTYWAGTGRHQSQFKRLRAALVTVGRTAQTPHGELLRAIDDVYHDLKRHGLLHIGERWRDWHTVYAYADRIAAALGPQGPWVVAVVDRAVTERYLAVKYDGGAAADWDPSRFPLDAFEMFIDGCVLVVGDLHAAAVTVSSAA